MEINFENKVVLVTGASAGIGEATAILFAKYKARLALVGRNAENLQKVGAACQKESGAAPLLIVADLATDEGCEKTAKDTINKYGRLDVLVNNAGLGTRATIQQTGMEVYDKVFNVNVRGVYNLTRLLVHELIKTKGNIINVSSVGGSMATVGALPYGMTKAALDHFTHMVAFELADKGVRVNAVSPGLTVSTFHNRIAGYTQPEYEDFLKNAVQNIPMGEVCSSLDIAKMIVFVASDNCRLVTGNIVPVDGGIRYNAGIMSAAMIEQLKRMTQ